LTIARMLTDLMGGELTVENVLTANGAITGSRFRVRLFLPEVHSARALEVLRRPRRVGYRGIRRRVLVVDNERDDREMLVNVLEPLGFQVAQAASGQECLDLLPRLRPHVVFMDLAMPGMDGWEALRRIRESGATDVELAILSANAFEKGADNSVGIAAGDFITKPLKVDELLDWLGDRLALEWVEAEGPVAAAELVRAPAIVYPDPARVAGLRELIELGYMRGILAKIAEIERLDPVHAEFARVMRELAGRFQFETMQELLRRSDDDHA
jgi:CheY-like chemotaxis protein